MPKHLFKQSKTQYCKKCNKGKSNRIHLNPSLPMLFNWLFDEKFTYFKQLTIHSRRKCQMCNSDKVKLTKHHLKYKNGEKTGEIQRLCRRCHDRAEDQYVVLGIVKLTPPKT